MPTAGTGPRRRRPFGRCSGSTGSPRTGGSMRTSTTCSACSGPPRGGPLRHGGPTMARISTNGRQGRALLAGLGLLVLMGLGMALWLARAGPTVRVGEVTIDPRAPINPERTYRLILWEENVVLSGAGTTYRTFLEDRVEAFR